MNERNPFNPGEDGSSQKRTLLAFLLMAIVLVATPYVFKTGAPQPTKAAKTAPAKPAAASQTPVTAAAAAPASSAPAKSQSSATPGLIAAHDEQEVTIDTPVYHVVFSNRGGVIKSWTLKKYPNAAGKPLELVNSAAAPKVWYPLGYEFRSNKPSVDLNQSLFVPTKSPNGNGVTFEYSNNGVSAKKTLEFQPDGYLTQITSEVRQNGNPVPHLLTWRGGFGDFAAQNASGMQHAIRFDTSNNKLITDAAKEAKDGPVNRDGRFSFAGLEDQYFAGVFLPNDGDVQTTLFDDYVPTPFDKAEQQFIGTGVGGEGVNRFSLFVGPKDIDLLRQVNSKLEQIVDFGMFWFLAKPLFLVLRFLNHQYVHNYGWSIIIVTIVINFLLFPLRLISMKSMKRMQVLQPEIQKINEKYKSMSMRDPRMQQKNQETMELYKKHGANPMAGCLPLLIQMPFLFAFYKVLAVSSEMRGASWLWVHDLSQPEQIALRILPILLIITGFLMQKMTPSAGMDPQQRRMMMFMPLVMGFFFYNQSAGLVLYWLTGNLMGMAQQYFFNKTMTPAEAKPLVKVGDAKTPVKKPVRK
jgi:YidC/Oxa1 family membrane protein insertase